MFSRTCESNRQKVDNRRCSKINLVVIELINGRMLINFECKAELIN
jgi:hypothetical protein